MFDNIVLRKQFIDRAGRTVYLAFPLTPTRDEKNNVTGWQEGAPAAQVRLDMEDSSAIEWLSLPAVDGDGTG
jgi:hypothetical protein